MTVLAWIWQITLSNKVAVGQASIKSIILKWALITDFVGPMNCYIPAKMVVGVNTIYIIIIFINCN
jgi:hypothetical protein